jgi:hypothetical protein
MALEAPLLNVSDLRERSGAYECAFAEPQEEKNDDRPATVSPAAQAA